MNTKTANDKKPRLLIYSEMKTRFFLSSLLSVSSPAVFPDLAGGSGERTDIAHLDHGRHKILGERVGVLAVALDEAVGGAAVVEDLVGVQKPLLFQKVLEVSVVEECRRFDVEGGEVVVSGAVSAGAGFLPLARERAVDVRFVVYTRPEHRASRLPYGVCPCIIYQALD